MKLPNKSHPAARIPAVEARASAYCTCTTTPASQGTKIKTPLPGSAACDSPGETSGQSPSEDSQQPVPLSEMSKFFAANLSVSHAMPWPSQIISTSFNRDMRSQSSVSESDLGSSRALCGKHQAIVGDGGIRKVEIPVVGGPIQANESLPVRMFFKPQDPPITLGLRFSRPLNHPSEKKEIARLFHPDSESEVSRAEYDSSTQQGYLYGLKDQLKYTFEFHDNAYVLIRQVSTGEVENQVVIKAGDRMEWCCQQGAVNAVVEPMSSNFGPTVYQAVCLGANHKKEEPVKTSSDTFLVILVTAVIDRLKVTGGPFNKAMMTP